MHRSERQVPTSTYRLQLNAGFTFDDATAQLDYLADLGVTHIFCSPILQAAPGSMHGYDVVDHRRISAEMGGEDGFRAFSTAAHGKGLGIIVDVVPNHMAVPTPLWRNHALWEVLREGAASAYANWFDIDLSREKAILMPVLGERIGEELAAGNIAVENREIDGREQSVMTYFDHVFPIRPGTEGLPLLEMLEQQWYRLAHWKVASEELNYRRFFDVDTLAAVRIEDDTVFEATHRLLADLFHEGLIDGFRIDHIDGLANPRHYFEQLQGITGGCWVVAEKILEADEQLPTNFSLAGTTGYEALLRSGGLFHDPSNLPKLDELWERVSGSGDGFASVLHKAKDEVIRGMLFTEVNRLTSIAMEIFAGDIRLGDHTRRQVLRAIRALLMGMDRYRAYVEPGRASEPSEREVIEEAAERARSHLGDDEVSTLGLIVALACGDPGTEETDRGAETLPGPDQARVTLELPNQTLAIRELRAEFMIRFAQTCGPVMAKSKEDTAFYRFNRFLAVNEVGSEPTVVGISPDVFHDFCELTSRTWPATMTTLSSHDTKRSEDVRARMAVLLEHPKEWEHTVQELRTITTAARSELVDGAMEMLLWQTLAATWSLPGTLAGTAPISENRLESYLTKAMRENKSNTSWTEPDEGYEQAVLELARTSLRNPEVRTVLDAFSHATFDTIRTIVLGQKLIQLTMPGVPDLYQGCELVDLSLVDPDNRRPVDFDHRHQLLKNLESGRADLDAEKLHVTSAALRLRREHPDAFRGASATYQPIPTTSGHAVAFARGLRDAPGPTAITVATRQPSVLAERGGWLEHKLILPEGSYRDVLGGAVHHGGELALAKVLTDLPVALLVRA